MLYFEEVAEIFFPINLLNIYLSLFYLFISDDFPALGGPKIPMYNDFESIGESDSGLSKERNSIGIL